ncbi:hypothetical protein OG552_29725 [Streptomyces sp. NBC_01476]|uniref:hypothetical protein n=1 Tax=Streptomyces sp. NBC_01476 TaxID=2903881 RepID=UPI002E33BFE6|nr:hypothetical protein [Streptomyces sp. NBC_01476]
MTHGPTAATTRRLLAALAAAPESSDCPAVTALHEATGNIRAFLTAADQDDIPAIPAAVLHQWRCDLDRHHQDLEHNHPQAWARWRVPGTWLDSHLRLRSLIAHEVGKAYWDDIPDIRYDAIDIERYLWGAR